MAEIFLRQNPYNQSVAPDKPKFKIWNSVGLMLTYFCPSRCACCYVFAGPDAGNRDSEMSVELAVSIMQGVKRLAGDRAKVHITGGEPFVDYERLENILEAVVDQDVARLEKIETNAYWCTSEKLVRSRLSRLKELGLTRLQISTDIYHQQYIPLEQVRLAVAVAGEVLGEKSVQVRWREFLSSPILADPMSGIERRAAFAGELKKRPERLIGRAAEELAGLFPSRSYRDFAELNCSKTLLGAKHVHVDGTGNVFSGTCIGIVVGKVDLTTQNSLEALWKRCDYRQHPIFSILIKNGPVGLLPLAEPLGYKKLKGYATKCHLCYDIRRFLHRKQKFPDYLGPSVCYGKCE